MQTVTIDIINSKALRLLQDLELLQLIRVRKGHDEPSTITNSVAKYKGAMTKQPVADIDQQLKELREGWE